MREINLLDCTLRDGSNAISFQFTKKDTENIVSMLDESGIDFIEIGHGLGMGANEKLNNAAATDEEYLQAACKKIKHARWGMFFQPKFANIKSLKLGKKYNMDFIRIGTNPEDIKDSFKWIKEAKRMNYIVLFSVMKAYSVSPEKFEKISLELHERGVDCIYFMDSAGTLIPDDIKRYFYPLINYPKISLGFHGHNNLNLAIANSLAALEYKVKFIDVSIGGLGRSAGNAQTEIFVMLVRKLGYKKNYDFEKLCDLNQKFITPGSSKILSVSEKDIIFGYAGFHSSFEAVVDKILDQFPCVKKNELIIEICKNSLTSLDFQTGKKIAESMINENIKI